MEYANSDSQTSGGRRKFRRPEDYKRSTSPRLRTMEGSPVKERLNTVESQKCEQRKEAGEEDSSQKDSHPPGGGVGSGGRWAGGRECGQPHPEPGVKLTPGPALRTLD